MIAAAHVFVGCNPDSIDVALCAIDVRCRETVQVGGDLELAFDAEPIVRISTLALN